MDTISTTKKVKEFWLHHFILQDSMTKVLKHNIFQYFNNLQTEDIPSITHQTFCTLSGLNGIASSKNGKYFIVQPKSDSAHLYLQNKTISILSSTTTPAQTTHTINPQHSTNSASKRTNLVISTYNVHTLLDNRIYELTAGCQEKSIDLVAIQEHRWNTSKDIDTFWTEEKSWAMIYATAIDGRGGIGILMNKSMAERVIDYHKISHRIMKATFNGNPKMTFISAHAPHGSYPHDIRKQFYDSLTDTIQAVPLHDILIIGGDLNAQLGKDLYNINHCHTYYDHTKKDSNGMLLNELCSATNMTPVQTLFQQPKSNLWTHKRPNGDLEQLDHILINRKWVNSVKNCRAYNSVEINSDHRILSAHIKLSLQSHKKIKLPCKRNWDALKA